MVMPILQKSDFGKFFFIVLFGFLMSGSNFCVIHFDGEGKGAPLTNFSEASFHKFLNCRSAWLNLDGTQRQVAKKSIQFISADAASDEDYTDFREFSYHRGCYSRFTNATDIKRAQARCQKKCMAGDHLSCQDAVGDDTFHEDETPPVKKVLRSMATTDTSVKPRNPYVARPVCIICMSEKAYITESVS